MPTMKTHNNLSRKIASTVLAVLWLQRAYCLIEPAQRNITRPPIPAGFSNHLFYDDFQDQTAGALPSSSKWTLDLGTSYPGGPEQWGTFEVQTYTSDASNIHITKNKTLKITPHRSANGTWTSARIETAPSWDFACPPGQRIRVEAKMKLGDGSKPSQIGIWPAFWALGSALRENLFGWPAVGEIDIMESINGEAKVFHVVHCGQNPGGACNEPSGLSDTTESMSRGAWHTLAFEIDRRPSTFQVAQESMSWFVDGVRRWTLMQSDVANSTAWDSLVGGRKMLLLNVAVGGAFPDAVAGFKTPTNATTGGDGASMEVKYVAVFV